MKLQLNKRFEIKDQPSMAEVFSQVDKIAAEITIGETLFFKEHGVKSEAEFKRRAIQQGFISKHSHLGWNSWDETARNIEYIYKALQQRGSYLTRMGVIFDWVMGVPEEYRSKLQAGTGLIFKTPEEWVAVGQIVPIQPHMSDHMIATAPQLFLNEMTTRQSRRFLQADMASLSALLLLRRSRAIPDDFPFTTSIAIAPQ